MDHALRDDWLVPLPSRLNPGHPLASALLDAHDRACTIGVPTYRDPRSGLAVFTARFLAERGYCCDSSCRHCPYASE